MLAFPTGFLYKFFDLDGLSSGSTKFLASLTILLSITQLLVLTLIVCPFVKVKLTAQSVDMHIVVVLFNKVLFLIVKGWISNSLTSQAFTISMISVLATSILCLLVMVLIKVMEIIRLDADRQVV